jgi:hypothetical protein
MAADLPENYNRFWMLFNSLKMWLSIDRKQIPEAAGQYITVARKAKGTNNWFVGM